MKFNLWSGQRIPIIMVSGPVNSGKTLFGLTVDPNTRRPSSEVQPTTLVYDQEGSSDSYAGALNFVHKDTRAAVAQGVHNTVVAAGPQDPRWLRILKENADCNDSPAASMFRAWFMSLLAVEPGQYAVGVCDTFTPLQDGMLDWLKRHPEAFGRTHNEYQKASTMFFWPDAKAMLSHILSVECRLRFETFVLTVHLKNEWASGSKTGRQVAEGLDVLEKLATVHLELDRSPKAKGKEAPRLPSAILKKERLVRFGATGDDDRPILPPRLPVCTPDRIREYIASPPDFGQLAADERLPDQSLSEDQKLLIAQETARNQAEAAQAHLSALELARMAAAAGLSQIQAQQAAQNRGSAASTSVFSAPTHATASPDEKQVPQTKPMITSQQIAELVGSAEKPGLMRQLFPSGQAAQEWLLENAATNDPAGLTEAEAMGVLSKLNLMKHERTLPTPPPPEPQPEPDHNGNGQTPNGKIEQWQRDRIRELTIELYADQAAVQQEEWLRSLGYGSAQSLTFLQAADRIAELERLACPRAETESLPF